MHDEIDGNKPTDMVWYKKPVVGYEVIAYARQGKVCGIRNPDIICPIEDRQEAIDCAIRLISQHWSRMETVVDVRIYAFGGMVHTFKVIQRQRRWNEVDVEDPSTWFYTEPANMVPEMVRFGTSTWTYEGWMGQVYLRKYTKTNFNRECLGEYCQFLYKDFPLFRTVGNDATFYRPPTANQLRHILTQIPEDFEMCFKVWEELTIPTYAKHPRYGLRAGQVNPNFLNAKAFNEMVLTPYREAKFEAHTGPFLFEFQRHGMTAEEFYSRLDGFFAQLPKDFKYAVEIRNPGLLTVEYRRMLMRHGVAHVYNHWCFMPSLADQHQRMEHTFTTDFSLFRLLTPLRMTYEAAKKRAAPYNKIVAELPEMRRDVVALVKQSIKDGRRAYVLVNNRSEGNAPKTIQGLVEML
jgi:uncharacterized protein YecE (DUF72 family)